MRFIYIYLDSYSYLDKDRNFMKGSNLCICYVFLIRECSFFFISSERTIRNLVFQLEHFLLILMEKCTLVFIFFFQTQIYRLKLKFSSNTSFDIQPNVHVDNNQATDHSTMIINDMVN